VRDKLLKRNVFRTAGVLLLALAAFSLCGDAQAQGLFRKKEVSIDNHRYHAKKRRGFFRKREDPLNKYRYHAKKKRRFKTWRTGSQGKLSGGIKNLLAAPMEIPATMNRTYRQRGPISALFGGTVRGLGQAGRRAKAGLTDVATFPTKYPNKSYASSMRPKGPVQVLNESRKRSYSYRRR